jgi:hypothetical protein
MGQPRYVAKTGTGSSVWQIVNTNVAPFNLGIVVLVTGTVTYTFEYTYEDPSGTYPNPLNATPSAFPLAALTSKTANTDSAIAFPIAAWRITVTAGTGTAQAVVIQSGQADS